LNNIKQYSVIRNLPVNFEKNDLELFSHELNKSFIINDSNLIKYQLITAQGELITLSKSVNNYSKNLPKYTLSKWSIFSLVLRNLLKFRFHFVIEKTIFFLDFASHGYFHWMFDVLPKLIEYKKENGISSPIYLPKQFSNFDFVNKSLKGLGFVNIKYKKPNHIYCFKKLVIQPMVAPSGNYNPVNLNCLKSSLDNINLGNVNLPKYDRIYISRKNASRRKLQNENEIVEILKSYNFKILYFEEHEWEEQIYFCKNARVIMGVHGAGLSNMIFQKKGSMVIELRAEDDKQNNCYFSLANALKHDYYYLLCSNSSNNVLDACFNLDKSKLIDLLKIYD
jgi:capsular polysaccharide biosynthesis protein